MVIISRLMRDLRSLFLCKHSLITKSTPGDVKEEIFEDGQTHIDDSLHTFIVYQNKYYMYYLTNNNNQ